MRVVVLALAIVAVMAAPARAHQSSIKYADITISESTAAVKFTIAPTDVTQPIGRADADKPTVAEALAEPTRDLVTAYVASWMAVRTPSGAVCVISHPHAAADPDGKFLDVTWDATCPAKIDALVVDFSRFFTLDQRHEAILSVHSPGERNEPSVVRISNPVLTVTPGQSVSLLGWIRHGMDHIYGGTDHICFVLSLLLVVVITRKEKGGPWELRSPLKALRSTAVVITAFTIAHSVSLILASLGYISLPSRFVESMIAASIVYTAVEDIVKPDVKWRYALTFGFGLIHGLGFASVLQDLLPKDQIIVPLLTFNFGVEIGQLSIVLVAIPAFWVLARVFGAERYRRFLIPLLASPLILFGAKWLAERIFDM
ncbi:MAG TPA: HupE/UreJ family protein [Kofleriaceae bacterium]|jgi:hypothetical protein